jgi:uncharacterized protein
VGLDSRVSRYLNSGGRRLANQLLSINQLKGEMAHAFTRQTGGGVAAYIAGGLCSVPLGLWLMANLPTTTLPLLIGIVLLAYCVWMVFRPQVALVHHSGPLAHGLIGMVGGAIGGFTAFPGCALVIWAGLKNLPKMEQRIIVQPYIFSMQLASLLSMGFLHSGELRSNPYDATFWLLFVLLMSIVLPMTKLGVLTFKNISDLNFKSITIGMLALSGGGLFYKGLMVTTAHI